MFFLPWEGVDQKSMRCLEAAILEKKQKTVT